jgi:hypothetical protein
MFMERQVQQVNPDKWEELEKLNMKYDALERKAGFPAKKRMRCYIGENNNSTLVLEREWESLAAMEAAYMKVMVDPAWQALDHPLNQIVTSVKTEVYLIL